MCACVHAKWLQPYLTLCDHKDCSPLGSSAHGILQAKILEWVAMPSSRGSSRHRDGPMSPMAPALAGGFFTTEHHLRNPQTMMVMCKVSSVSSSGSVSLWLLGPFLELLFSFVHWGLGPTPERLQ